MNIGLTIEQGGLSVQGAGLTVTTGGLTVKGGVTILHDYFAGKLLFAHLFP